MCDVWMEIEYLVNLSDDVYILHMFKLYVQRLYVGVVHGDRILSLCRETRVES